MSNTGSIIDCVIAGGGYVGLSTAVAIKASAPHLSVTLIDAAWTQVKADKPYVPIHHQVLAWGIADGFDIPIAADDAIRPRFIVKN